MSSFEEEESVLRWEMEEQRTLSSGRNVWVPEEKVSQFDENEKKIDETRRELQALSAERQAEKGSKNKEFLLLQKRYVEALELRDSLISPWIGELEVEVPVKRKEETAREEEKEGVVKEEPAQLEEEEEKKEGTVQEEEVKEEGREEWVEEGGVEEETAQEKEEREEKTAQAEDERKEEESAEKEGQEEGTEEKGWKEETDERDLSAKDIVDYIVYTRKRSELLFKRDFLLRHGAGDEDIHIKALKNSIDGVERRLLPISEKVGKADLITIVPNRKEIETLTQEIQGYNGEELDEAITRKKGLAYELLRERAALTKRNFEKKVDIAMLTILLNGIPRSDAVRIRDMMENGDKAGIDLLGIAREKQENFVKLANKLGFPFYVANGTLAVEKADEEVERKE